jgi:hypothetical protein
MKKFLPRLGFAVLGLLVLTLVLLVTARIMFAHYLHSEAFRRSLGEAAANALQASRADFSPLEFDGSLVYGENFTAARDDGGAFSTISADQLRASFDWHGLLRHKVQIDELKIERLNVQAPARPGSIGSAAESILAPLEAPASGSGSGKEWTVDLRKAVIGEANWHWSDDPPGGITGVGMTLVPDGGGAWVIEAQGGTVRQAGWPALELENADMRWQSPTLYITSSSLRNGSGRLSVTGSVETRQSVDLQVKLEGVDIQPLLSPDWRAKLSGRLAGQVHVQAPLGTDDPGRAVTVSGSATLTEGELTALPILDEIGTFTQTERFRRLELSSASADFTRTPDRLDVRNLVVESEGLIRVEGDYSVVNGQIDGTFQVGLTPATLQWIPGAQEQVFLGNRAGYRWASMRLTGPAEHPVDDLTPRLAAAAGTGVIQGAEGAAGTVEKAATGVLDLLLH